MADRARREPVTITTPDGHDAFVVFSAQEYARLERRDRRVGLAEEWLEAVRNARLPDEFAGLDAELKQLRAVARALSGPRHPLHYLWRSEHLAGREEGWRPVFWADWERTDAALPRLGPRLSGSS